jgi:ADP-ribose pyrophosphatase
MTNANEFKFLKLTKEPHPNNGKELEFILKPNAIAALFLDASGERAFLVEQYRPGARGLLKEIPAGIIEEGESALNTLYREIREETGYIPDNYEILYTPENPLILSPGYTTEGLYVYVLKLIDNSIQPLPLALDDGEELVGEWVYLEDIPKITTDFKTIFALNLYKLLKK